MTVKVYLAMKWDRTMEQLASSKESSAYSQTQLKCRMRPSKHGVMRRKMPSLRGASLARQDAKSFGASTQNLDRGRIPCSFGAFRDCKTFTSPWS